jgi:uncharacterized protein (DUF2141 family)
MKRYVASLALAMLVMLLPETANSNPSGKLTVAIDGLRNQAGQVCLNLFSKSQGFPNDRKQALQTQCVEVTEIPLMVTFQNLPTGSYAIAVYHDANQDNQFNRNSLGMPTEGFGFSGNPKVLTRAPKFGESVVLVAGENTTVPIQLQYF